MSIDHRARLDKFLRNQSLPDSVDDADSVVPASFLKTKLYFIDPSGSGVLMLRSVLILTWVELKVSGKKGSP